MNSEKVKEIKKALEDNANYEHYNKLGFIDGYKCKTVAYADILTYINELESENERLNKSDTSKEESSIEYYNLYKDFKRENQELKDRIAELEKENEKLLDSVETVQNDRCVFKCELTKKQLKQFAERLKERCHNYYPSIDHYCCSEKAVNVKDIDELLKEYEK